MMKYLFLLIFVTGCAGWQVTPRTVLDGTALVEAGADFAVAQASQLPDATRAEIKADIDVARTATVAGYAILQAGTQVQWTQIAACVVALALKIIDALTAAGVQVPQIVLDGAHAIAGFVGPCAAPPTSIRITAP